MHTISLNIYQDIRGLNVGKHFRKFWKLAKKAY